MAQVRKVDSNIVGLAYSVEPTFKNPGSTWFPLDPNSYNDFGGNFIKTARTPINSRRSRYKGVLTDLDSAGGFNIDMTQTNIHDLFQGFTFDTFTEKGLQIPTAVSATAYTVPDASDFLRWDLIFVSGFAKAANNGLKMINTVTGNSLILSGLSAEARLPPGVKIVRVGHQFTAGDCEIDVSGDLPRLTTSSKNLTDLDLVDGELVYLGGDAASTQFANDENNGWCRIRNVNGARSLTLDKASGQMAADSGTGKSIHIFFGRTLKNKEGSEITRTSYQLERELGAPDDASPDTQTEYIVGAVPNQLTMAIDTADKIMVDMDFMGVDYETRTASVGAKPGTRPGMSTNKAFNTSTHVTRLRMSPVSQDNEFVDTLFTYVTEVRLTINNNISVNKAVGTLGGIDVTAGTFEVGGNITAYFQDVSVLNALRDNADVTLDICVVKDNAGFAIDMPLLALDDGRLNVALNEAVTLPLGIMAADAEDVNANFRHTLVMSFFDYLPDVAEA